MSKFARRPVLSALPLVVLSLAGLPASMALAQDAAKEPAASAQPAEKATPVDLLKDFIYYTRIDNYEVAAGYLRQLKDLNLKPVELVQLVEGSDQKDRFEQTVPRAMRKVELEELAGWLFKTYEQGKLERARDPEQIKANIALLSGTIRGRLLGSERLKMAGEYAMPQLLAAFLDRNNPALSSQVRQVIVSLGSHAVVPLVTALPKLSAEQQELVVNLVADVPYSTSIPFLADLAATSSVQPVKDACQRAIERLGGSPAGADVAGLYQSLAESYYQERKELTSFSGEDFQLLWSFDAGTGLLMSAIRTPVYHEAMAMRLATRSLELRPDNPDALALWVSSNFSREIDTPAGYENPTYAKGRRDAMYYAVASGAGVDQRVLGRALATNDTPLARRAIAAIEQTAGGTSLWADTAGQRPLLSALTYPNRRVQFDAALALAAAQPNTAFDGSERVVPILAGAIHESANMVAAVVAPDNETYQAVRGMLERMKFSVLPYGKTLDELAPAIADAPSIDLVVSANLAGDSTPAFIDQVRGTSRVSASPIMVLTRADVYQSLRRRYETDQTVSVRQSALAEATVAKAIQQLIDDASGGALSTDEATSYAKRSLAALRDLAVSGNSVLSVSESTTALIAALGERKGAMRLDIAEILARIGQDRSQIALMDAAMASSGAERVELMHKVTASARRFGSMLQPRHVDQIVELVAKGPDPEANAAAALLGALGMKDNRVVPLILEHAKK